MRGLQPRLEAALQLLSFGARSSAWTPGTASRTPMMSYKDDQPEGWRAARYQTDLLMYDEVGGGDHWVPRVVIECKIKGVTTHDSLTYSGKAATHKRVHPYLWYGMSVGSYGSAAQHGL